MMCSCPSDGILAIKDIPCRPIYNRFYPFYNKVKLKKRLPRKLKKKLKKLYDL